MTRSNQTVKKEKKKRANLYVDPLMREFLCKRTFFIQTYLLLFTPTFLVPLGYFGGVRKKEVRIQVWTVAYYKKVCSAIDSLLGMYD